MCSWGALDSCAAGGGTAHIAGAVYTSSLIGLGSDRYGVGNLSAILLDIPNVLS